MKLKLEETIILTFEQQNVYQMLRSTTRPSHAGILDRMSAVVVLLTVDGAATLFRFFLAAPSLLE